MNLIDTRTKHQKLYDRLVKAQENYEDAKKKAEDAKNALDAIWENHLKSFTSSEEHPIESERVIVQDGGWLYEINFDVDDFGTPEVRRIDRFTKIHKID